MTTSREPGFETICVHFAEERQINHGAAAPPLYQCSTFTYPDAESFVARREESARYDYSRVSNPTTTLLEKKIAQLERGEACRAFGSGMAAVSAAILSCVKSGDHVVTIESVYGPTRQFLSQYLPRLGIETTFVRGTEVEQFESALRPNTRLIYLESPSSLIFALQDLSAVAKLARSRNISTICDNSNASPYFQNPLTLGVDIVLHSATKYIGGHSDVVAGLVVGSRSYIDKLSQQEGELFGGMCDPFASWLLLRGLRTLAIRMERHQRSAREIARLLETDGRVAAVNYSGTESHAQAALAKKQMRGHSGMFSFGLRESTRERTFEVVNRLRLFCIGVSWGGFESLAIPIEVPDPQGGRPTWLIRLSIGLESVEDLKADLYQALG